MSATDTDEARRRVSKRAKIIIASAAALAVLVGGGTIAAIKISDAREQARIEVLCVEAHEALEASQVAYNAATAELNAAIADARSEEARGYVTDEVTPQALVDAEALVADRTDDAAKDSSTACTTEEDATSIAEAAAAKQADAAKVSEAATSLQADVDKHVVEVATADHTATVAAYDEAVTAGEASYQAASETDGFAGSAEDDGKLEALRTALDAKPDLGEAPTTRAEVTALDEAIAAIKTATTAVDEARGALDSAVTGYNDRIAAEKKAAEEAAAKAAEAERQKKAQQAKKNPPKKNTGSNSNSGNKGSGSSGSGGSGSGSSGSGSGGSTPGSCSPDGKERYTLGILSAVCRDGKWTHP